jgi:hypothetical protein
MNAITWSLDKSRIFDGYVFATPGERCQYIGTLVRDRPQWLKKHVGRWRRVEDVRQEAAAPGPPVESEIGLRAAPPGPNGQTSSRDVPKDGDDDDDVALVDALAGDCSLPCQPTSLPTPVTATLTNRSTKAELLPPAKAAMSEAEGPKTETTPLGAMRAPPVESETKVAAAPAGPKGQTSPCDVQKDGDGKDGVALADALLGDCSRPCEPRSLPTPVKENAEKQKPPAGISKSTPKLSPERMRIVLNSLRKYPVLSYAANKAGIHRRTLEYWINCSAAGHDGYDIKWQGVRWRFHEHCKSAIDEAENDLHAVVWQIAWGVIAKTDENGNLILEACGQPNMKMMRFYLELKRPERWRKNRKTDIPQKGGVLVIGSVTKKPEYNTAASVKARKWKSGSRRIRETKA